MEEMHYSNSYGSSGFSSSTELGRSVSYDMERRLSGSHDHLAGRVDSMGSGTSSGSFKLHKEKKKEKKEKRDREGRERKKEKKERVSPNDSVPTTSASSTYHIQADEYNDLTLDGDGTEGMPQMSRPPLRDYKTSFGMADDTRVDDTRRDVAGIRLDADVTEEEEEEDHVEEKEEEDEGDTSHQEEEDEDEEASPVKEVLTAVPSASPAVARKMSGVMGILEHLKHFCRTA